MSNLIKREEICPAFTSEQVLTVRAAESVLIYKMDRETFFTQLINAINEALLITGQKNQSAEDIAMMCKLVGDKLLQKHPNYRIKEIFHAVKNGAFGEYDDDVVFVSAKNILKWCTAYQSTKLSTLMKQQQHRAKLREEEREIENEKRRVQYWNDLSKRVKEDLDLFNNGEALSLSAEVYFNSLQKIEIICIDPQEKMKLYKKIRDEKREKAKNKFSKIDTLQIDSLAKTDCRIIFYSEFLDSIGDNWSEMEEMINENIKKVI